MLTYRAETGFRADYSLAKDSVVSVKPLYLIL